MVEGLPAFCRRLWSGRRVRVLRGALVAGLALLTGLAVAVGVGAADENPPVELATPIVAARSDVTVEPFDVPLDLVGLVTAEVCGDLEAGSGFVLADGRLVTATHVVGSGSSVVVTFADGTILGSDGPARHHRHADLSLLDTGVAPDRGAELAPGPPPPGTPVAVVGYGRGGGLGVAYGRVGGVYDADDQGLEGQRIMVVHADANFGNSGGPVFDDRGRVVGVLAAVSTATGSALVVPVDELWQLLDVDPPVGSAPGC